MSLEQQRALDKQQQSIAKHVMEECGRGHAQPFAIQCVAASSCDTYAIPFAH